MVQGIKGPKGQHFLPKMFLKGFSNQHGHIYMYDSVTGKIVGPRSLNSVAKENHLYTVFQGDEKNFSLESFFSKIESDLAPFFENLRSNGFDIIKEENFSELMQFIAITFTRSPFSVDTADGTIDDPEVQKEILSNNTVEGAKFIEEMKKTKGLQYAMILEKALEYRYGVFVKYFDIVLQTADEESDIIINDKYLCVEPTSSVPYEGSSKDVDWGKVPIKMHFPLSKKLCLTLVPKNDEKRKGTLEVTITNKALSGTEVKSLNKLSFMQKNKYIYASKKETLEELLP